TYVLFLFALSGCAHLHSLAGNSTDRMALWAEAHDALAAEDFSTAEATFQQIALRFPGTLEARESTFYLGTIRLDPRNPAWDPEMAETYLGSYIANLRDGGPRLYRYPEAVTMHE